MKVFIIGGTRFIGMYAVQALLEQSHEVVLFNRSGPKIFEDTVQWIQGDRNDTEVLENGIRDASPDVILDMIPVVEKQAQGLMKAARGKVSRVVSISSMDVYQAYGKLLGLEPNPEIPATTPFDEEAPLRSVLYPYRGPEPRAEDDPSRMMDDYDKIPIESCVMNDPEIQGTVLRLPIVYGPGDGQHRMFEFLRRMMDQRPAILIKEEYAHWRTSRAYAADVGHGISLALTDEAAAGQIFNISAEPALSTLEWIQLIAKGVGWSGKIILTGPESTPEHLDVKMNSAQHLVASSDKIRRVLGYSEPISHAQGILRTIEWEAQNAPPMSPAQLEKIFNYSAEDEALDRLKIEV